MTAQPKGPQAALIGLAVRFRGITVALACLLVVYGLLSLRHAEYGVYPEFAPPQVGIQTEAPGLSPEQVELLVTRPIEAVVTGLPGVQAVRSNSIQGLSAINLVFAPGSDINRDRQLAAERLASVAQSLPQGVAAPALTPLTTSTSTILVVGLTSTRQSLMTLHTTAEWTVRRSLLAVPGVADATVFGGEVRSIQIQLHPDQLRRYGVATNDVLAAARNATGLRGAGVIDTANQRIVLQSDGQMLDPRGLARTIVSAAPTGRVTLGDVAEVVEAPEPPIGAATVMGKPGVIINITQQYGADTLTVTRAAEAALADLKPALAAQGIMLHDRLFRPADFIGTALANIQHSLLLGGVLVVVVLFLFLFNLRTAAIACTAIPLSLLTATLLLSRFGITLNTMTLGGLAIAIGEVVDDAVIGIENIVHRLRENQALDTPRPRANVVIDAVFEVRSAVVYATLAVILVFVPVIALSGLGGRLFAPLGIAYILAVLASLLVALTVTPALGMMWLSGQHHETDDAPVARFTRSRYESILAPLIGRAKPMMIGTLGLILVGCAALPFFSLSFIPKLKEGHFILHMAAAPGTSLNQSLDLGARVTQALRHIPEVRSVSQRIGRAEKSDDIWGPHYSEFDIDLVPLNGAPSDAAEAKINRTLGSFVGASMSLKTFLTERVEETLSGTGAPVAVNIFGDDLDAVDAKAAEVATALKSIPGAADVQVLAAPGLPQLGIRLRPADLQRWGMNPVEVLDAVRIAYQGDIVGQTYEGDRAFNVIALMDRASRDDPSRIADLPIRTPGGTFVPLRQLADIVPSSGRYQVRHDGGRRVQTVTVNVPSGDIAGFVANARERVGRIALPAGTYITFAGTADAQAEAQRSLFINTLVAAVGIVLLLAIVTRNSRNLLLVLANLPFACVGGVLAVLVTGGQLSLGALVGFVTLAGITLRNSIMMIAHFEHLVTVDGRAWNASTAIEGASDRLVPIVMTSLVTALGLLPLAIGMGDPGREVEGPMAAVILGGLMTSMLLNLLVLPTLALAFGRFGDWASVAES
ncbi:efflux RND transporter permease subunit [uncultured Sphingomonas sp.]|uniref:efflux RND transporter permease subunit n=1 Tax=uncultured Sphingomonas sp. TaxID=158754 RepID=UPI0026054A90|nr:efflux RND transporter permease subunit [uncultured Sphingomonas sp.]